MQHWEVSWLIASDGGTKFPNKLEKLILTMVRWEFGIQVPFGIFVVVIGAYVIPSSHTHQLHKGVKSWKKFQDFDWAGSFYLVSSLNYQE